jgi:hypothetical protein
VERLCEKAERQLGWRPFVLSLNCYVWVVIVDRLVARAGQVSPVIATPAADPPAPAAVLMPYAGSQASPSEPACYRHPG